MTLKILFQPRVTSCTASLTQTKPSGSEISVKKYREGLHSTNSHLDGVNHSGDEHCEDDITIEISPLGYGTTHDGCTGGRKGAQHWFFRKIFKIIKINE